MNERAVFLDKDGTLVEDVPYNVDPDKLRLMPDAGPGLRLLRTAGYRLIVISNQSGVARGLFAEEALAAVHDRLRALLEKVGVPLDGFYYCPHRPAGSVPGYAGPCVCRKPQPGLLQRAAREQGIALERSWFVGDILDDVEAGRRAGSRTILLHNGHETEWALSRTRLPHYVALNLAEAAELICVLDGDVPEREADDMHERPPGGPGRRVK